MAMHTKYCLEVMSWLTGDHLIGPSVQLSDCACFPRKKEKEKKQTNKKLLLVTFGPAASSPRFAAAKAV